jgi:hypothetical protein
LVAQLGKQQRMNLLDKGIEQLHPIGFQLRIE